MNKAVTIISLLILALVGALAYFAFKNEKNANEPYPGANENLAKAREARSVKSIIKKIQNDEIPKTEYSEAEAEI